MRHAYDVLLRLYPESFRRRYGVEMSLDFADGWTEARARGRAAALAYASRVVGDLAMSLLREWLRGPRLAIAAVTAVVTVVLWGLVLRPWMWTSDIQPGPPPEARGAPPVTEAELLGIAAAAMLPVIVVLLFATRLVKRRDASASRRFRA